MIQMQGVRKRITALFIFSIVWALFVASMYSMFA
jgi:hypothetical protein